MSRDQWVRNSEIDEKGGEQVYISSASLDWSRGLSLAPGAAELRVLAECQDDRGYTEVLSQIADVEAAYEQV